MTDLRTPAQETALAEHVGAGFREKALALAREWDGRAREAWERVAADPVTAAYMADFGAVSASTYEKCARELRAALKDRSDEAPDWEAAATAAAIEIAEGLRDAVETNARLAKAAGIEAAR